MTHRSIAFAWTTPALLTYNKIVTRREWDNKYGASFEQGDILHAYDRQPRFGGLHVADIRLTCRPYLEPESKMPEEDYAGEGFEFLNQYPQFKTGKFKGVDLREYFDAARDVEIAKMFGETEVWVVRFEVIKVRILFPLWANRRLNMSISEASALMKGMTRRYAKTH